jgi:hypothetical protein
MGFGYKGDTGHYHTLGENAASLKKSFKFNPNSGYFGDKGDSPRSSVRHIASKNPLITAKEFYDKASYGGIEKKLDDGKFKTVMKDGTTLVFREISNSDGTPAVEIFIQSSDKNGGIKTQKIHFVN